MQNETLVTDRKQVNFRAISAALAGVGLWCFPQAIVPRADGYKKKPLIKWKPFQDRPPTHSEIENWAARYPDAGAGIPTGPGTGIFVVDADNCDAIEYLEKRGMSETWLVRTRRGLHYYYRYADFPITNSAGQIATAVDVRGRGGQAVAPGTRHPNGCLYTWDHGHSPVDLPLAEGPAWLLDELRERSQRKAPVTPPAAPQPYRGKVRAWARKAFDANLELLTATVPGTRNDAAFAVSRRLGQLVAGGELEQFAVLAALNAIADGWRNSAHTRDTIRRGLEMGYARPRSAPATVRFSTLTGNEPLARTSAVLNDEAWRQPLGGAV